MNDAFPSPTTPVASTTEIFLGYLDYFRGQIITKTENLGEDERRRSRLPSGWTPRELVRHLAYVELRWLEWGFEGRHVEEPWGDRRADQWYVAPDESTEDLIAALKGRPYSGDRPGPRPRGRRSTGTSLGRRGTRHPGAGPVPPRPGVRPTPWSPRCRGGARRRSRRRVTPGGDPASATGSRSGRA